MLEIFDLETCPKAEVEGVVKEFKGAKVTVARSNNPEYVKFLAAEVSKYKNIIDGEDREAADEKANEINKEAFCRHILVGWEGFTVNGEPYPYSPENAAVLYDRVKDLVKFVFRVSSEEENYYVKTVNKQAEELKKP